MIPVKMSGILAVGYISAMLGSDAGLAFLLALAGIIGLVWYEAKRKFKHAPPETFWDYLDRNTVRLVFAAIIAPQSWNAVVEIIKHYTP